MAEAGFYHSSNDRDPDIARCFVCFKELEGWEPDDNPWYELFFSVLKIKKTNTKKKKQQKQLRTLYMLRSFL